MPKRAKASKSKTPAPAARSPFTGILRRLLRVFEEDLPVTELNSSGKPNTDVQGTKEHQHELEDICEGRSAKAAKTSVQALIRPQPKVQRLNVEIKGLTVGFLKPADAKHLERQLAKAGLVEPCCVRVPALIVGGKVKRSGETEDFYVKVALPPRPVKKASPVVGSETTEEGED